MEDEIPPKSAGNLQDYEVACKEFTWASVDKEFDWSKGSVYNIAYEAIDRHALNWRKNKIALYSVKGLRRGAEVYVRRDVRHHQPVRQRPDEVGGEEG